jgi:hypothetical protein
MRTKVMVPARDRDNGLTVRAMKAVRPPDDILKPGYTRVYIKWRIGDLNP